MSATSADASPPPSPTTTDGGDRPDVPKRVPARSSTAGRRPPRRFPLVAIARTAPPCALLLGAALLITRAESVEIDVLLRDTVSVVDAPLYTGLVSNVGIALWGATVAIAAFAAAVLRGLGRDRSGSGFLAAAAALTAWLMLDDALLFHEQAFRQYLGLPGVLSVLVAGLGLVALLVAFRREVRASDWPALLAALCLFALSVTLDALDDAHLLWLVRMGSGPVAIVLEDGGKLLGIALWLHYFSSVARERLSGQW